MPTFMYLIHFKRTIIETYDVEKLKHYLGMISGQMWEQKQDSAGRAFCSVNHLSLNTLESVSQKKTFSTHSCKSGLAQKLSQNSRTKRQEL
jgi:hypothetical protein